MASQKCPQRLQFQCHGCRYVELDPPLGQEHSVVTDLRNYKGESGLGKSTLVNTLFNTSLYPPKERKGPSMDIIPKTVSIQSISADIEENGVRLRLTVVDTPGFGDFVNNDDSWRPIVENIENRFDTYLESENKVNRMNIVDNRVHACVYFIQPTGHSLKPLDIEVMRRLHTKVNLIPVIAKADTMTDEEIAHFKQRVSLPAAETFPSPD